MDKNIIVPFLDLSRFYKEHKEQLQELTNKVFESGRLMDGEYTRLCEEKINRMYNYPHTIMVGSCTDALFFALKAAGIKPNDEVIITSFSFIASLTPILRAGAVPVFVDIDPDTCLMDYEEISSKISSKTRAILAVHLYGQVLDMEKINTIAESHWLIVIEDAAQSIGIIPNYGKAKKSEFICLSFDPTKVVHAFGSGGAVVCNDDRYAEKIKQLRYHGRQNKEYVVLGYNSRISEQQAALMLFQLNMMETLITERKTIAKTYLGLLSNTTGILLPDIKTDTNFHKFVVQTDERDQLRNHLLSNGVNCIIHYEKALYEHGILSHFYNETSLPNTQRITKKVLSLPIFVQMNMGEIEKVCKTIRTYFSG